MKWMVEMGVRFHGRLFLFASFLVVLCSCSRAPTDAGSRYRAVVRARALLESGDLAAAQELFERVVQSEPRPDAWVNLGWVQHARGKRKDAARSWSAALELNPVDVRGLQALATLRLEEATRTPDPSAAAAVLAEARELAERAAGVDATNAAIQRLLESVQRAQGDSAAARSRREAERLDPGRAGANPATHGFVAVSLPALRRAPHFSRTPPRFEARALKIAACAATPVDLDGNGLEDLLLAGSGAILMADSARAETRVPWLPTTLLADPVEHVVVGLFDGDAATDLIAFTRSSADSVLGPRQAWLVHGGQRPRVESMCEVTETVHAALPMDIDRDGDLDLVLATSGESGLRLWRNDGAARFADAALPGFPDFGAARALAAADLDSDGALDLLCTDALHRVRVLMARGADTFVDMTPLSGLSGQRARAMAGADVDADGDDDVLLGDDEGLWLWRNEGASHFVRVAAYRDALATWTTGPERGVPVAAIHVADLDNDALVDVVTQHFPAMPAAFATLAAESPVSTEDTAPNLRRLEPLLDVPATTRLALWHNEGDALFTDVTSRSLGGDGLAGAASIASGDFDRDGDLDLVGAGADSTVLFWWNVGGTVGRSVEIELVDAARPATAVGAHVELYVGELGATCTLRGAVGWLGVGSAQTADVVRIVWPDGQVQNHLDVTLPERGRLRIVR